MLDIKCNSFISDISSKYLNKRIDNSNFLLNNKYSRFVNNKSNCFIKVDMCYGVLFSIFIKVFILSRLCCRECTSGSFRIATTWNKFYVKLCKIHTVYDT